MATADNDRSNYVTRPLGTWSETTIGGHPADLFEPAEPSPHGYVVLYLHGVHVTRLRDIEVFTRLFDRHGLRVIAPVTGPSWWTDRICDEFDPRLSAERHLLDNIVPHIAERWGTTPPRIALLGTSMGGQGALRLAFKHPSRFPSVAALSPAIDFHLRHREGDPVLARMYPDAEAARQDTATLAIRALNYPRNIWFACDPNDHRWHESAERLRMKLAALGIPHECDLETEAGGHGFAYYNHMAEKAVGFAAGRLETERLRIPG
jgi:enterochelin esterase-like enzyme